MDMMRSRSDDAIGQLIFGASWEKLNTCGRDRFWSKLKSLQDLPFPRTAYLLPFKRYRGYGQTDHSHKAAPLSATCVINTYIRFQYLMKLG